ncbi:MAG: hypothetical protein AAB489_03525 [Patescibacteria group bacterium]
MKYVRKTLAALLLCTLLFVYFPAQRVMAYGIEFNDTFTEPGFADVTLASHTPDTGTSWTKIINGTDEKHPI